MKKSAHIIYAIISLCFTSCSQIDTSLDDCQFGQSVDPKDVDTLLENRKNNDACYVASYIKLLNNESLSDCEFLFIQENVLHVTGFHFCSFHCQDDGTEGGQWVDRSYSYRMAIRTAIAIAYEEFAKSCAFLQPESKIEKCCTINYQDYCSVNLAESEDLRNELRKELQQICDCI